MSSIENDAAAGRIDGPDEVQPLRDGEATSFGDPQDDPAQAEWDRTEALDDGASADDLDATPAMGRDPDELPAADEISGADPPGRELQPESQADDPLIAELGEDGEGDLSPGDV